MLVCFVSILRTVRAPLPPPGGEAGGHSVPAVAPAQTARWRQRLDVLGVVAVEGAVVVVVIVTCSLATTTRSRARATVAAAVAATAMPIKAKRSRSRPRARGLRRKGNGRPFFD